MTTSHTCKVLVVEDDTDCREPMAHILRGAGYKILEADNGDKAIEQISVQDIDILISDLRLPGSMDGIELLKRARTVEPEIVGILTTVYGTIEAAVEALKGAPTI